MAGKTQAAATRITPAQRLRSWLKHHADCLAQSVLRLRRAPAANLLTATVLAIALALPGTMYMLTRNVLALGEHWQADSQVTLYLYADTSEAAAAALVAALEADARLAAARYLSRERALAEFKAMTGFGEALDGLEDNPLPPVILVSPRPRLGGEALRRLTVELAARPPVEAAQYDWEWLRRLQTITEIIQRGLLLMTALLAAAVVLVVGNTIRLEIQNRREEIVITALFGATPAFIRRPFLYDGALFGLLGGVLACALMLAALLALSAPVGRLIALYHSDFRPLYPGFAFAAAVVGLSGLLGYLGAWVAVGRHIEQAQPE